MIKEATQERRLPRQQDGSAALIRGWLRENPRLTVLMLLSGLCLFVFYSRVHPLYVHDLDDWLYVFCPRDAYPDPTEWNPTKILPETLMPLLSYLGAYFVYPITGDYIQALCDVYAVAYTACILVYLLLAAAVMKKWFRLTDGVTTLLMSVFLLGHFLPFQTGAVNQHLFWSLNVTCVFNYQIPGLWNYILCLWFLGREEGDWEAGGNMLGKGMLVLGVYLAIFSSLWHSVILMSLFGIRLLYALIRGIRENLRAGRRAVTMAFLLRYARRHLPKLVSLCAWFFAMLLEVTGERSAATAGTPFLLGTAIRTCIEVVLGMNKGFLAGVILTNLAALTLALLRRKEPEMGSWLRRQLEMGGAMVLCGVFMVLLGAKVGVHYLPRADVMMVWMLWLMLMTLTSASLLVSSQPRLLWIAPIVVLVLLFETVIHDSTYQENYVYDQPPRVVKDVSSDIVSQILEADAAGQTSAEVHIPVHGSDGWPLDMLLTPNRLGRALYDHGLTERFIEVTLVPDPAKDAQLLVRP